MDDSGPCDVTIDLIGVNPRTGYVELAVIDDRAWEDYQMHMSWLIAKLNLYIGFVSSGEINKDPKHAGRPVKFLVYFNGRPLREARLTMQRVRNHLAERRIAFAVTENNDIRAEVDIDAWANEAD